MNFNIKMKSSRRFLIWIFPRSSFLSTDFFYFAFFHFHLYLSVHYHIVNILFESFFLMFYLTGTVVLLCSFMSLWETLREQNFSFFFFVM